MLGALAGDIIGSIWEMNFDTPVEFPLFTPQNNFTDDSVLTCAVSDVLMRELQPTRADFAQAFILYYRAFPHRGYGKAFKQWATAGNITTLGSFGNGCAMRVSPIGWFYNDLDQTIKLAADQAYYTHNSEEGIRGAAAMAAAVFMARGGVSKKHIARNVETTFSYDLSLLPAVRYAEHKPSSCQASVPLAIRAFLDSDNFESAIRIAISYGGDCDTLASMAGAIAEAFYKEIPEDIQAQTYEIIGTTLTPLVKRFRERYVLPRIA